MNDAVAEIKSRISIEDVVSEYVQLKRSGRNYKGLSPFTSEKSPSFMVSPEKQIWHDFSSGKGGDVFSFIMEVEGLDFKGALELLARKSGVDLDVYSPKKSSESHTKQKTRYYQAVEQAVKFYQVHLTKNHAALTYLREKRKYEKQTLVDFRFGYSPEKGDALYTYLSDKGFSKQELQQVGLVGERAGRVYDMFRGRIMIPLMDAQGRPVGFTARQLHDSSDSPKYINTPSTILYDKGRQLFGFSQAKEAIRKSGFAVVVEGNLDVVASHQAGIKQVVASAGTALTQYHLKDLKRFTGDIRLSFDVDRAGQEAAERTIPLAQALSVDLSMITLPEGKDPDELIQNSPQVWREVVEKPQYMVDWLIDRVASSVDMKTAQGKRLFTNKIISIIQKLSDKVEQEHYIQIISEKTGTSTETLNEKMNDKKIEAPLKRVKNPIQTDSVDEKNRRIAEQHLLALCMKHKEAGLLLATLPLDVFSIEAQETASYIQQHPGVSPDNSEYAKMLTLLFEEQYQHTETEELTYQAYGLLSRLVQSYTRVKKQALAEEMDGADDTKQNTLLRAVKQLDDLVVQFSKKDR